MVATRLEGADVAEKRTKRGGFLIGVVIGAGAGLLLAPRAGKEMRDRLFGIPFAEDEENDRLHQAVDAGRESAAASTRDLKQKIEETRERLRRQAGINDDE